MSESYFLVERGEDLAVININRPEKRNAFKHEMWGQLSSIVSELTEDPAVGAIIIRGAGRKVFCAGADISEFEQRGTREAEVRANLAVVDSCLRTIKDCPKAVVAMIYGFAMGGGCALALACDLRFVGESAKFGVPSAKLGVVYSIEATTSLVAIAGPANGARILYTGAAFDAQTSYEMGIATAVYPDDQLEGETYALARQIAHNAPLSIAGSKRIIQTYLRDPGFVHAPDLHELAVRSLMSADHLEGARAFMEKRKPVFRGNDGASGIS